MDAVGVAQLRNNLSSILQRVKEGIRVVITDHGRPVAELSPYRSITSDGFSRRLTGLVEQGTISISKKDCNPDISNAWIPIKIAGEQSTTDIIRDMRDA